MLCPVRFNKHAPHWASGNPPNSLQGRGGEARERERERGWADDRLRFIGEEIRPEEGLFMCLAPPLDYKQLEVKG